MDTLEEFIELESLLPTMNDLTSCIGFQIDDNEENIWHRIIRHIDYNQKESQKDSSYQQKFFQHICKQNCIKNGKLSKYFDTYGKSHLKFCSAYPLQAMIIIFENKICSLFNEYYEKRQKTVNLWQRWFDETIEAAKNVVKETAYTRAEEQEWEMKYFASFFKLASGNIKCEISMGSRTDYLTLAIGYDEVMPTKCQEYVAWCWKYYQTTKEVEAALRDIRNHPPCDECYND